MWGGTGGTGDVSPRVVSSPDGRAGWSPVQGPRSRGWSQQHRPAPALGEDLGASLGAASGAALGAALGASLGAALGEDLGAALGAALGGVVLCWELGLVAPTQTPAQSRDLSPASVVVLVGFCPFLMFLSPSGRQKGHCWCCWAMQSARTLGSRDEGCLGLLQEWLQARHQYPATASSWGCSAEQHFVIFYFSNKGWKIMKLSPFDGMKP